MECMNGNMDGWILYTGIKTSRNLVFSMRKKIYDKDIENNWYTCPKSHNKSGDIHLALHCFHLSFNHYDRNDYMITILVTISHSNKKLLKML